MKDNKWYKWAIGTIGAFVAGAAIMLGGVMVGNTAISQLVGLAVAQSATLWNNVADAAKGDALTNGILAESLYLYNGTTFDRARGDITNGLDVDVTRLPGATTPSDAFSNPTNALTGWSLNGVWNGTTWNRLYGSSSANNAATLTFAAPYTTPLSTWGITNSANAGTPSASKAAGGGTVKHVATSISICVGAAGTAQPVVQVNLRDGASGAGTIIRSWQLAAPINTNACNDLSGLNMSGSANTAMTIEFAAATAAATQASVNLTGYSTP
jgi:hypothetical protein